MVCGECTLCCKMINIPWMNSPAGVYCKNCSPGKGCNIFKDAPEDCKEYSCLYCQMEKVSVNLRPDVCHVIFEKINDEIVIVTGLVEEGYDLNTDIQNQIASFLNEGLSVFLSRVGNTVPLVIPSAGKTGQTIFDTVLKGVRQWQ